MKFIKLLLSVLLFLLLNRTDAQKILRNSGVDHTKFPEIKLKIESKKELKKDNLIVNENGKAISEFELRAVSEFTKKSDTSQDQFITYMFENSPNVGEKLLKEFIKAIKSNILILDSHIKINIVSYGKSINNEAFVLLNSSYTNNKNEIIERLEKVKLKKSKEYKVDTYKALFETLKHIKDNNFKDNHIFIMIGVINNFSKSAITEKHCVDLSKQLNIPIHTIGMKLPQKEYNTDFLKTLSTQTNGIFELSNTNKNSIENSLSSIQKKANIIQSDYEYKYEVLFKSQHSVPNQNTDIQVVFQNDTLLFPIPKQTQSPFNNTEELNSSAKTTYIVILVFVFLIALGLGIYFYLHNQKKKSKRESISNVSINQPNPTVFESKTIFDKPEEPKTHFPKPVSQNPNPGKDLHSTIIAGVNSQVGVNARLELINIEKKATFTLQMSENTIGRNSNNSIVISDNTVSSNHAKIFFSNGYFFITDLNSTNGTFVKGNRIQQSQLNNGDMIQLGAVQLIFRQ